jgi:beta-glucanase (GH16 family)
MLIRRAAFAPGVALLAGAVLAAGAPAAHAVTKSCGPGHIAKPSGGDWVCTFGDDFKGKALNRKNWDVLDTGNDLFSQAGECYVDDPDHIRVAHGHLILTATRHPQPSKCGLIRTRYQSGMVLTKPHFEQTYGRFKARLKMPAGDGFQSAFWMWPAHKDYSYQSGEIDVAEAFGNYPDVVSAHTHIRNALKIDVGGHGANCDVPNTAGTFHNYVLVWQPTEIRFTYDGHTCLDLTYWDPGAPLTFPQPFDKPFFLILQLALGYGSNAPAFNSPFPAHFVVDYVRAWR